MKILLISAAICMMAALHTTAQIPYDPMQLQPLPLKTGRTVAFTTDEGSYMNLDLSPDGKTLLFDLLGDIYIMPASGGKAKQLTRGIAINARPVWSPDGKKFAFISDTSGAFHLSIRDVAGSFYRMVGLNDKQLDPALNTIWLPSGQQLIIGGNAYSITGGNLKDSFVNRAIRFSADGRYMYYVDSAKLKKYDHRTGFSAELTKVAWNMSGATLSPDESYLVYADIVQRGLNRLMAVDLRSGKEKVLVKSLYKQEVYPASIGAPRIAITPDSRFVYTAYMGKIHRIALATGEDQVVPFTAEVKADMASLNYNTFPVSQDSFLVQYIRNASVRVDRKQLLFAALGKVYTMSLPGGKPVQLTDQPASQFQPVYSPDGKWIVYTTWEDTAGGLLWKVSSDGGKPIKACSERSRYLHPAWSPDGKTIAVMMCATELPRRSKTESGKLCLIDQDGKITVVADAVPELNHLSFSSDGSRIRFRSSTDALVSCAINGQVSDTITVSNRYTNFERPHQVVSPDGNWLLYEDKEDFVLLPLNNFVRPQLLPVFESNEPSAAIRFASGMDSYWSPDGRFVCWTAGNKFCRVSMEKIVQAAAKTAEDRFNKGIPAERRYLTAIVRPDEEILIRLKSATLYGKGTVAFTNATIITMKGDRVIEKGVIIVRNGRIAAVGTSADVKISKEVKVYDLNGKTIIPGMVDVHLHLNSPMDVYGQQDWQYLVSLAYGVTTSRDPYLQSDLQGRTEMLRSGKMTGPRLYSVGRPANPGFGMVRLDEQADADAFIKMRQIAGSNFVKQYYSANRLQKQWLLSASRKAGMNMTNEGGVDPLLQIAMLKDGNTGIEHSAMWGDAYKDVIQLAAASGTFFTPTLMVVYSGLRKVIVDGKEYQQVDGKGYFNYKFWRNADKDKKLKHFLSEDKLSRLVASYAYDTINPTFQYASLVNANIRKAGGKIALGSHGDNPGTGPHSELWALQMGGLTNLQALQAATITGAEAIGIQKDLGSIEVGKIADLLILNKNPLEDIHNSREILYVMKDGVLYDGDTLDTLWPYQQKCPEWKLKKW